MIDIHHHCLPDVDDGPTDMADAVAMCRAALEEGIDTIVATPHVLRGRWQPLTIPQLTTRLAELRSRVGDAPRLVLGSEYYFGHDIAEVLEGGASIVPLAGSRYILIEFAANAIPPHLDQPLYRLQMAGWVPVIAHPERNLIFQAAPDALDELLRHGARTQVTAGSLTGEFGREAKAAAETFLRRRMVHFIATDAHDLTRRPPKMRAAMAALEALAGPVVARALTHENPLAVLENRPLVYDPEALEAENNGFFTRLRSFLKR